MRFIFRKLVQKVLRPHTTWRGQNVQKAGAASRLRALSIEPLETRAVPSFLAPTSYKVGGTPNSIAVGDFTGNGIPDLAVIIPSGVNVLLGNGDGTFQPARTFAAGDSPFSVAVGDFNGDGIPDLAVAQSFQFGGTPSVSLLFGNGDGTFRPAVKDPAPFAASVTVGDFRGNGILDLAMIGGGVVNVLLGNGDGTFQPAHTFAAGTGSFQAVVGDFNGDGIPDLAVVNQGTPPNFMDGSVSVLLGNGDGTFQPARTFAAGNQPDSVAVGDFTGNHIADLAVANRGSGTVSVLLGNGDGTFQPARNFPAGVTPTSVAAVDFNGDGKDDLAVTDTGVGSTFHPGHVRVLLSNSDGRFHTAGTFDAGDQPGLVTVGDFNGDGSPDLAITNKFGTVAVLLGTGAGTFPDAPTFAVGSTPFTEAVGDFNGDGIPDLAVANAGSDNVSILLGNGDGTFRPAGSFPTDASPFSVAVGDFRGNGIVDLAVTNQDSNDVSILLGNGDGTFQPPMNYLAGSDPFWVTVGDFRGDGKDDLAVANFRSNNVSILLGNGDGTFQDPVNYAVTGSPRNIVVADFTGNGIPDLAVAGGSGVRLLLGNGDGTFQPAQTVGNGTGPFSVAVGDFNGDGIPDLAVTNIASLGTNVSVLFGNGDGTFQAPRNFTAGGSPTFVAVGDFAGNGKDDLAVTNSDDNDVSVFLGNGDGTFQGARNFVVGDHPQFVVAADFTGNRRPDLAVVNQRSNNVSLLLNDGNWPPSSGVEPSTSGPSSRRSVVPLSHASADRDHSGKPAVLPDFAIPGPFSAAPIVNNRSDAVSESALSIAPRQVPQVLPMIGNESKTSPVYPEEARLRRAQDLLFMDIGVTGLADPLMEALSG